MGLSADPDVVVVGGGLAGLASAMALVERGLTVTVLEREPILGGRARSWTDRPTGHPVHIGPHILLSAYANMLDMLGRLGTVDRIHWLGDGFIDLVEGTTVHSIRASALPAPFHFLPGMVQDPTLTLVDLASNARVSWRALRLDDDGVDALDRMNALGFLRAHGVTEAMIERFWNFTAMAILNVPVELCSAGALMRFYRDMISHSSTRIGLPTCGLGELFAPAAADYLAARGATVETGVTVAGFLEERGRVVGVRTTRNRRIRAGQVIAALPPAALRRLLPVEWLKRSPFAELVQFHPCPYVSTYLWFDRKLTDRAFWARVPGSNDLNCDFYDLSNTPPGWPTERSIIAANTIFSHRAADLDDAAIVARTRDELAEFLPAARDARIVHSAVHRIEMAIHCPFPGTERARPVPRSPIAGLWLAGDWVRTGVPACMEGAVHSGNLVAEQILAERGRAESLVRPLPPTEGISWAFRRIPGRPRWLRR